MATELGGVTVTLKTEVDSSGAVSAATQIVNKSKEIETAFKNVETSSKSLSTSLSSSLKTSNAALKSFIEEQVLAGRTIDENGNIVTAYGVKAKGLTNTFKELTLEYSNNRKAANTVGDAMSSIDNKIRGIDTAAEMAADEISQLSTEIARANAASNDFVGPMQKLGTQSVANSNYFKMQKNSAAQLGMQIQDVAVMAQYGADKFVILGTQGSQIASLFGPGGAMLGAMLAIGAAVAGVTTKMFGAAEETKNLREELTTLGDSYKLTADEQAYLNSEAEQDEKTRKARIALIEEEIKKAEKHKEVMSSASFQDMEGFMVETSAETNQKKFAEAIAETSRRLLKLRAEMSFLSNPEETRMQAPDDSDEFSSRIEALKTGIANESEILSAWHQTRAAMKAEAMSQEEADAAMADIKEQQRLTARFDATKQRLEDERKLLEENQNLTAEEKAARQMEIDTAELEAKALHDEAMRTQEMKNKDDLIAIAEDAAQKEKDIEWAKWNAKMDIAAGVFSGLSSLMNTESRKLFEIGKAAAISNSIVSGIQAAVESFKNAGGYPLGIPAAAASAATTFAQIQQIKSTSFGSTSAGQTISGGVVATNTTSTTETAPQQVDVSVTANGSLASLFNFEVSNGANFNLGT